MSKFKSKLAIILASALLITSVAGCAPAPAPPAGGGSPSKTSESGSNAKKFDGTTITFAASQNWIKDIDREMAAKFKEETGVTVDFQLSPDDQYQEIIKSKLNTGEGIDIFMSYSGAQLAGFNPEQNMVELSDEPWVDKMKDWAIAGSTYNDKLYAFNMCSADGTNGVLYQPEMFEKYNLEVPTNYEEFKNVCKVLKENDIIPIFESVQDLWHAHYWMEGVATKAYERDKTVLDKLNKNEIGFADVPEFETALKQIKELSDLGYLGENHMSNSYDNSYKGIASGKYGMIIIHSSYPNEMENVLGEDPDKDTLVLDPDKYSMFANPLADNTGITLTAGGPTRCISSKSKSIEACKEYFKFLSRPENAQAIYDERTEFMEASMEGIKGNPTVAYEAISKAETKILGPEAAVYFYQGGKISEYMQELFAGSMDAKGVLEAMDEQRRALAKDAGYDGF